MHVGPLSCERGYTLIIHVASPLIKTVIARNHHATVVIELPGVRISV